MGEGSLIDKIIFDAHYAADGNTNKLAEILCGLIVEEAANKVDELRSKGFIPTGYLIRNHFGIK